MPKRILENREFWGKLGVVAAATWLGFLMIASAISRDFVWTYQYKNEIGPALVTAMAGLAIIAVICAGVPWVAESARKPPSAGGDETSR
jgi:lysylphosphatidylglycerol synthetase-like protein (DUF2156 family)